MRRLSALPFLFPLSVLPLALRAAAAPPPAAIVPAGLRCEYAANPLGIDAAHPHLSWLLAPARPTVRNERQTAFQLLAATDATRLTPERADLWNTGRVLSDRSLDLPYAGKPLRAKQRVYWRVRTWDREGNASPWSEAAWWEMGLLNPADWGADWITSSAPPVPEAEMFGLHPSPLFRKPFTVRRDLRSARLWISGLGYYEAHLNGAPVGDHRLDPGWTEYRKRVPYDTYDVTRLVHSGPNALGVMLGNGWYNPLPLHLFNRFNLREVLAVGPPRLIARLELRYADGTSEAIRSDASWKVGDGPSLRNSVYLGEIYDARREQKGWDTATFDDRAWRPAAPAHEALGPLRAQAIPPVRAEAPLSTVRVTEPKPGIRIYDLGRNFAGTVSLRVEGDAGTRVVLRYGELLNADGTLNPMTSVTGQIKAPRRGSIPGYPPIAWQTDSYTLRGGGPEQYVPRFNFHGFRYAEVTVPEGKLARIELQGVPMHTDVPTAGSFSCSNELFNRIQQMFRRTELSNLFSVQSDCPHREKLGYGGDMVATSETGILNWDMSRFYAKTVRDFADDVRPNGGFTETAPFVGIADQGLGDGSGPIGWGTVHPVLLEQLYRYYGNRELLAEQYPYAQRWLALLQSHAVDGILENGIGDHETLAPKSLRVSGTFFYWENARLLSRIAAILGRTADSRRYAELAASIHASFFRHFVTGKEGRCDIATQACQAMALMMDGHEETSALLKVLEADLAAHEGHLTTGIFGTRYLLRTLSDHGRGDLAYRVADQKSFPGWGWMLENGATTMWEHWAGSDNTFSHNHPMFGSVSEWFIRSLGGIRPEEGANGCDRVEIRPTVPAGLQWVNASYHSVRGAIRTEWRQSGGRLTLTVEIPPNVTGTVHLPTASPNAVTEGGRPAAKAPGVKPLPAAPGEAVFQIGSGRYQFTAPGS